MGRRARVSREQVMGAARAAFAERGFEGTTLASIGARLGVSPAAVLRHAPTKEALFSAAMEAECARGDLGIKLAFARLSFNYFITEQVFQYILEAVHLLADHGAKFLPLYRFDPASGLWRHRASDPAPTLADAAVPRRTRRPDAKLARQLADARRIIRDLGAAPRQPSTPKIVLSPEFERIRWFPLPGEAG